ncbi:MAG: LssY C-terminal domain-containing protein [Planctomycetales bacterium]|nr:LssY C-terminal domain-containing protein [Planctomycetales bacterium]
MTKESNPTSRNPSRRRKLLAKTILGFVLLWIVIAYVVAPFAWERSAQYDPKLDTNPRITQTSDRHPGDPLNVALIGTAVEVQAIMNSANWHTASALGLDSDLKIAVDTVFSRPDDAAPVSSLYLFGRKEDFAFEQPVGDNPRHRHHVRLWKTDEVGTDGRPKWIGSAVYDERVGLSRTTGQITHVTAPDVDIERDYLFECLGKTGRLKGEFIVRGFHIQLSGRNGGGDPWRTDGDLHGGVIQATATTTPAPAT